jgi:predicted ATPase
VGHHADIEGGLLERAAALDALGGFLADARAGRGRLVFLHGEAGIGKSALLRRCASCTATRRTCCGAAATRR